MEVLADRCAGLLFFSYRDREILKNLDMGISYHHGIHSLIGFQNVLLYNPVLKLCNDWSRSSTPLIPWRAYTMGSFIY